MHSHAEIRHSPHTPAQLYALVLDIERYPEFLPWCRAARIVRREGDHFIGELVVSFSGFTERYSSKVAANEAAQAIEVSLVSGPFTTLSNAWKFEPAPQGGTNIHFAVAFEFKSRILDKLMGNFFARAVDKMGDAFVKRADALYGKQAG
jgi:coenzyme Q-binding protein COQ10